MKDSESVAIERDRVKEERDNLTTERAELQNLLAAQLERNAGLEAALSKQRNT
jgi:hypothetical protein